MIKFFKSFVNVFFFYLKELFSFEKLPALSANCIYFSLIMSSTLSLFSASSMTFPQWSLGQLEETVQ